MPKGKLIVIDGGDASGKTEQTRLLVDRMKKEGLPVGTLSFPRYETPSGALVRDYLNGGLGDPTQVPSREASMLYAYDRWAAMRDGAFEPLESGTHLVLNRYVASNMGHQGSKSDTPEGRSAFFAWNDRLEHEFYRVPRPDLNLILHVPAEVAVQLLVKRGNPLDGHENLAHLKRAEETYLQLAKTYPNCVLVECMRPGAPLAIDGLLPLEDIHELVWGHVERLCATIEANSPA